MKEKVTCAAHIVSSSRTELKTPGINPPLDPLLVELSLAWGRSDDGSGLESTLDPRLQSGGTITRDANPLAQATDSVEGDEASRSLKLEGLAGQLPRSDRTPTLKTWSEALERRNARLEDKRC